ncbi:MAG: SPASM domain-containing protein [Helicobacteraceae bacterium]|nr:SPASM domain-containing protein [Helicobacteraceae bacterium]
MRFKKIYIEISDICGLKCDFCNTTKGVRGEMPLALFKIATNEAKKYTNLITLHILGDPLKMKNINSYLKIAKDANLKVEITTSGVYLSDFSIFKEPIKQVNISLDALNLLPNRNIFLQRVFRLCEFKLENNLDFFINLRIQNRDKNGEILEIIKRRFNLSQDIKLDFTQKRIRLAKKIILDLREIFFWQNDNKMQDSNKFLDTIHNTCHGTCYGLRSHIGILSNGDIVPCCIDVNGNLTLGNIQIDSIKNILESHKTKAMIEGFRNNLIIKDFCKNCDYRNRFSL